MTVISNKPSLLRKRALKHGYRSGLEEVTGRYLEEKGVANNYESVRIGYTKPTRKCIYRPDFPLPNGVIIETKGRFLTEDRQKHKFIKEQHPDLDIRFVFSNSRTRLTKVSLTTYAAWCEKNGFKYADKTIPEAWLKEPVNAVSLAALKAALA